MSAKFIELNEAAKMLGVSTDELNEMRLRGEIHGVRDGTSWKFKSSEVERVAEEREGDLGESSGSSFDLEDSAGTSSDLDLGIEAADVDAPTAIGSMEDFEEMGVNPAEAPQAAADQAESSSDLSLDDSEGESSVDLMEGSGSDLLDSRAGSGGSDELGFEGSDLSLSSGDSLDDSKADSPPRGSGAELSIEDDDELALGDDDELVLGSGSGGSGDVTGGTGDTGVNLTSPSDSGLNLEEEPLDLAGSSVSSLELPEDEDDEILDLEALESGSDMQMEADEDFNLTPSDAEGDDEEDSGSQVIALEDSEAFEEEATVLATGEEPGTIDGETEGELGGLGQTQGAMAVPASASPETPYSVYNIVGLVVVVMILALAGMLMTDLIRNIWSWDQPYTASTSLMDLMVNVFGLEP